MHSYSTLTPTFLVSVFVAELRQQNFLGVGESESSSDNSDCILLGNFDTICEIRVLPSDFNKYRSRLFGTLHPQDIQCFVFLIWTFIWKFDTQYQ